MVILPVVVVSICRALTPTLCSDISALLQRSLCFSPLCHRARGGIAPSDTAETRSSSTPPSSSCISCTRRPTWTWNVSSPPNAVVSGVWPDSVRLNRRKSTKVKTDQNEYYSSWKMMWAVTLKQKVKSNAGAEEWCLCTLGTTSLTSICQSSERNFTVTRLIPGLAMVLTAALEFDPRNNKEATTRPTDNIEVPQVTTDSVTCSCQDWDVKKNSSKPSPVCHQLIRELGNINVKKKEPPFCYPYSLKARVLVLAHLARMDLSEELEEGKTLVSSRLALNFGTEQSQSLKGLFHHLRSYWGRKSLYFMCVVFKESNNVISAILY